VIVGGATVATFGHRLRKALWRMEAHLSRPNAEVKASGRTPEYSVLIVCLGNYCRSPVAEGVLRAKLAELGIADSVRVESAGTSTYYAGRRPHRCARREALRRGIDIGQHRAQGLDGLDLSRYDLVVAVDECRRRELTSVDHDRLVLLGTFGLGGDIPDPNGLGPADFAETHDAIEAASVGLARFIADRLAASSDSDT
jgi:low molecular weight protein-tyrosine phosphatase